MGKPNKELSFVCQGFRVNFVSETHSVETKALEWISWNFHKNITEALKLIFQNLKTAKAAKLLLGRTASFSTHYLWSFLLQTHSKSLKNETAINSRFNNRQLIYKSLKFASTAKFFEQVHLELINNKLYNNKKLSSVSRLHYSHKHETNIIAHDSRIYFCCTIKSSAWSSKRLVDGNSAI